MRMIKYTGNVHVAFDVPVEFSLPADDATQEVAEAEAESQAMEYVYPCATVDMTVTINDQEEYDDD